MAPPRTAPAAYNKNLLFITIAVSLSSLAWFVHLLSQLQQPAFTKFGEVAKVLDDDDDGNIDDDSTPLDFTASSGPGPRRDAAVGNDTRKVGNTESGYGSDRQEPKQSQPPPLAPAAAVAKTSQAESGQTFVPGTLEMSRLETFRRCYIDPGRYRGHFRDKLRLNSGEVLLDRKTRKPLYRNTTLCSVSYKYGLVYHQIEKSGSSTMRLVMKEDFNAREQAMCRLVERARPVDGKNSTLEDRLSRRVHHFTAFRAPLGRFVSSYNEMLRRYTKKAKDQRFMPLAYANFSKRYWNVTVMQHFQRLRRNQNNTDFLQDEMAAFEQFVQDYDAVDPFDTHLRLQVPRMADPKSGRPFHLDQILDTGGLHEQLQNLSHQFRRGNSTIVDRKVVYGRYAFEHMNMSRVSAATKQKICQLSALDFCCLNYRLPPPCQGHVQCQWTSIPELDADPLITAVSPYPPQ